MLCVSDLDFRKVYKSSLAVGLSGFLEHAVILCSTELNIETRSFKFSSHAQSSRWPLKLKLSQLPLASGASGNLKNNLKGIAQAVTVTVQATGESPLGSGHAARCRHPLPFKTQFKRNLSLFKRIVGLCTVMSKTGSIHCLHEATNILQLALMEWRRILNGQKS